MLRMTIPTYWKELAGNVGRRLHYGKVMVTVLGASDTGKTTLSFYLAKELLSVCGRVSIVSADMGQGAFGPPATVSMALLEAVPKSIDEISTHSMYFVGSTSPVGHFLQTLTGVKKLVDRASGEGAEAIIIDTTGLVSGGAAWELKFHKIVLTDTRCIVALERERELEEILLPYKDRAEYQLYRLPVSEDAKVRSAAQRREHRRLRYRSYFSSATSKSFPLHSVCLISPHNEAVRDTEGRLYNRLLVGLNDGGNYTVALGVIEGIDPARGEIHMLTPLKTPGDVRLIRLGSVKIEEDWNDVRIRPV